MERLPTLTEIDGDLRAARSALAAAEETRRRLRRRTHRHDPERQKKLTRSRTDLARHGSVLRSHKKRADWHDRPYTPTHRRALRRTLRQLRLERQQLGKMLPVDELT
jgi:hypothetical protein